ncbi:MAG TPA: hypothetical protein VK788_16700 [Terriglobales bacterium]|jgi:hypothetical protein|nr:hypothetical protein [Terriglobales bacterium]
MQGVSTENTSPAVPKVRWSVILPLLMSVLSALLMVLAKRQQSMLWKVGTGYEVPARVINALTNGPGFYFGHLVPIPIPHALNESLSYDGDRIFGVVLLWFIVGLSIERRINKQALDLHHPIRAGVLFAFAALICGVSAFGGMAYIFCPSPNMACWDQIARLWPVLTGIAKYPLRTSHTMVLSVVVWLLALCAYFARRAFNAAQRSLATRT